jgi:hypothetical protein
MGSAEPVSGTWHLELTSTSSTPDHVVVAVRFARPALHVTVHGRVIARHRAKSKLQITAVVRYEGRFARRATTTLTITDSGGRVTRRLRLRPVRRHRGHYARALNAPSNGGLMLIEAAVRSSQVRSLYAIGPCATGAGSSTRAPGSATA